MWNKIVDEIDIKKFMHKMCQFHDSCIKEIKYLSGSYVSDNLAMYAVNDCRILRIIIQRQFQENPMIELEFSGLKFLKLFPLDDTYTCEIHDSVMLLKDNYIYWCDDGDLTVEELDEYEGLTVCAKNLRWRSIDKCMGPEEFYPSII